MLHHVAIVATIKEGAHERAAELLAKGPPYDASERGLARHLAFVSAREIVLVFEGSDVGTTLSDLVDDPLGWGVIDALSVWRELIDGPPRIAPPVYVWDRSA